MMNLGEFIISKMINVRVPTRDKKCVIFTKWQFYKNLSKGNIAAVGNILEPPLAEVFVYKFQ